MSHARSRLAAGRVFVFSFCGPSQRPRRLLRPLSSWPGLSRPSTSLRRRSFLDVDARHRAGHDGSEIDGAGAGSSQVFGRAECALQLKALDSGSGPIIFTHIR
jgi:hypothetical protein